MPIEVAMDPEEYKKRLRAQDRDTHDSDGPQDPGNRAVNFRGEKRSNATHRSTTDRDCRFASKGTTGSGAIPGYTVNALMENRHRILLGIGVEIFRSSASETEGCKALLRRAAGLVLAYFGIQANTKFVARMGKKRIEGNLNTARRLLEAS